MSTTTEQVEVDEATLDRIADYRDTLERVADANVAFSKRARHLLALLEEVDR